MAADPLQSLKSALEGRYTIEHELGRGGNAVVYLANDLKHARKVALKVLSPGLALSVRIERFFREIQISAHLNHPHVLTLIDSGQAGDALFYVMPYVEGESLRLRLTRERQLPVRDALAIARDVAEALSYAHGQGVVHRDIKPENILLHQGHAVVMDFGIARALSVAAEGEVTEGGIAVGTPAYMSPEQAAGENVDARSDLYSLGCVLFEMLAGRPPFTGANAREILARHTLDAVPRLASSRPQVPGAVARAIERALAKSPADRFENAGEMVQALLHPDQQPSASRRRWIAVAAILVVAGAGLWLARAGSAREELSLGILRCQNLSNDPNLGYLSDGMTEDLINLLARLPGMRVPGFASASGLPDRINPQEAGRLLGVASIMTCTVHRADSLVRVAVQLLRADDGAALWGNKYERVLRTGADISALQEGVALDIAGQLKVRLSPADTTQLARVYTDSVHAWELYKKGRGQFEKRTPGAIQEAIGYFVQATTVDTNYALAYSGLADAYLLSGGMSGTLTTGEAMAKAEAAALKAVAHGANLAEAHTSLARVLEEPGGPEDFSGAETHYRQALALNPSYVLALSWYGRFLAGRGRQYEDAIRDARVAVELEPLMAPMYNNLGLVFNSAMRPEESVAPLERAIQLDPEFASPYLILANSMSALRRADEAIRYGLEAVRRNPRQRNAHNALGVAYANKGFYREALAQFDSTVALSGTAAARQAVLGQIGRVYGLSGEKDKAVRVLHELRDAKINGGSLTAQSLVYLGLGDTENAARALSAADSAGAKLGIGLLGPIFDPIRKDSRFEAVLSHQRRGA